MCEGANDIVSLKIEKPLPESGFGLPKKRITRLLEAVNCSPKEGRLGPSLSLCRFRGVFDDTRKGSVEMLGPSGARGFFGCMLPKANRRQESRLKNANSGTDSFILIYFADLFKQKRNRAASKRIYPDSHHSSDSLFSRPKYSQAGYNRNDRQLVGF